MQLHIGVYDVPEPEFNGKSVTTTYQVAQDLEAIYHLFSHFVDDHIDHMTKLVTKSVQQSLHQHIDGEEETTEGLDTALSGITLTFQNYVVTGQLDDRQRGVPTRAAREGRRRLKGPTYEGPPRPSFDDTSTFVNSLHTWVEK
jgi:hypothetical protein